MKPPKQQQRLLTGKQYRAVYEKGQKFHTPFFSAFILRTETGFQRLGLTTTRKMGNAVLRNRCRRRLRAVFRLREQARLVGVGYDLVLNVRANVATAEYQEIRVAFEQMLQRFSQALDRAKDESEKR